ncbi:MAG: anti-sigma factor family protein [Actinophytocola sp.]|uniref:anti-sigma factor family protein n=1 Tax=Actinophytocola sp. TaxID=1872138 RepID=UPI003D6AC1D6
MTCANTVTLGAYLLGALDPMERFEFEAHLSGCDTCRAELVRLAPLPGMLNQISLDDFSDGLPPTTLEEAHPTAPVPGLPLSTQLMRPETSVPELLHPELFRPGPAGERFPPEFGGPVPAPRGPGPAFDVPPPPRGPGGRDTPNTPDTPATASRGRRYWKVAAAAAVVLVIAIGGVLGWQAVQPDSTPAQAPGITWRATTPDGAASADARLVDHEWGTEIQVKIHGMPPGRQCYMVVYDHYGNQEVAGWWGTDHDYAAEIPASTSFQRSKIEKLELRLDDRTVALTIPAQGR